MAAVPTSWALSTLLPLPGRPPTEVLLIHQVSAVASSPFLCDLPFSDCFLFSLLPSLTWHFHQKLVISYLAWERCEDALHDLLYLRVHPSPLKQGFLYGWGKHHFQEMLKATSEKWVLWSGDCEILCLSLPELYKVHWSITGSEEPCGKNRYNAAFLTLM